MMKSVAKVFLHKFLLLWITGIAALALGWSIFMITVTMAALPMMIMSFAWIALFTYANLRTPKKGDRYEE